MVRCFVKSKYFFLQYGRDCFYVPPVENRRCKSARNSFHGVTSTGILSVFHIKQIIGEKSKEKIIVSFLGVNKSKKKII